MTQRNGKGKGKGKSKGKDRTSEENSPNAAEDDQDQAQPTENDDVANQQEASDEHQPDGTVVVLTFLCSVNKVLHLFSNLNAICSK